MRRVRYGVSESACGGGVVLYATTVCERYRGNGCCNCYVLTRARPMTIVCEGNDKASSSSTSMCVEEEKAVWRSRDGTTWVSCEVTA